MLPTLNELSTEHARPIENTMKNLTQLLNYAATHPNAVIKYYCSQMSLWVDSDSLYLSVLKAQSCVTGYHYLSDMPLDPSKLPNPDDPSPPLNAPVLVLCQVPHKVLLSAAESEVAGLF